MSEGHLLEPSRHHCLKTLEGQPHRRGLSQPSHVSLCARVLPYEVHLEFRFRENGAHTGHGSVLRVVSGNSDKPPDMPTTLLECHTYSLRSMRDKFLFFGGASLFALLKDEHLQDESYNESEIPKIT